MSGMTITVETPVCPYCGDWGTIEVDPVAYARWRDGESIQLAMPELSAALREQLMSGIHRVCWDTMFLPEDE
jgi:hypothetical protein